MKKVTLLSVVMLLALGTMVKAQTSPSFIIKGGVNIANVSTDKSGNIKDANNLTSFHVGVLADLPILPVLSIQPGLIYSGKGTKGGFEASAINTRASFTTNPHYLEVPVNLVVKAPIGENFNVFVGAGPYAAVGLGGKYKYSGEVLGNSFNESTSIKYSNDNPFTGEGNDGGYGTIRRFDYGLNATAGVMLNKFIISANYGHGLAKLQSGSNSSENELGKHRVLSFSVGFRF